MCKGLPASGKTTWAKAQTGFVRINKDDIREELGGHWSREKEKLVIGERNKRIVENLISLKSVIIDDTNFNPVHERDLKDLANKLGAIFEIKYFTDVPLEVCLERDSLREKKVSKEVIMKMYDKYLKPRINKQLVPLKTLKPSKDCVIFDMDGTLSCIGDRSPYDCKNCGIDLPNWSIITLLKWVPANVRIFIFSGRTDDSYKETVDWLDKYNINFNGLFMRKFGDNRKDSEVKKELFDNNIKERYNVLFAVDDRDQVVDLWRSLGITCLQANKGNF